MRIRIETPVRGKPAEIMARFDRELFEALSPPGAGVEIVQFDGSQTGDRVHIRLKLLGFIEQDWISEIVEHGEDDNGAYFIDQGLKLPFFLKAWRHEHRVFPKKDHSVILDKIYFEPSSILLAPGLYPALYAQFAARKPIYKKFFGKV
ncbi:MAG: cyclase [Bacteroidota bacterium]